MAGYVMRITRLNESNPPSTPLGIGVAGFQKLAPT